MLQWYLEELAICKKLRGSIFTLWFKNVLPYSTHLFNTTMTMTFCSGTILECHSELWVERRDGFGIGVALNVRHGANATSPILGIWFSFQYMDCGGSYNQTNDERGLGLKLGIRTFHWQYSLIINQILCISDSWHLSCWVDLLSVNDH